MQDDGGGNPGALFVSGSGLAMEVVAMPNIIKFPKAHREHPAARRQEMSTPAVVAMAPASKWRRFFLGLFGGIWLITTVLSPLLE